MADQRSGQVRDEKDQKDGEDGVTIEPEDVGELDRSTVEIRNEKDQKDVEELEQRGEVRDQKVGDGGAERINKLRADKDIEKQESNEQDGCDNHLHRFIELISLIFFCVISFLCCCCIRRRKKNFATLAYDEGMEDLEFGRDTNRNEYFAVTPFSVYTDKDLSGIADNYGGGGGGGGGRTAGQASLGFSSNNAGGEAVIQAVKPETGGGAAAASETSISPRRWWKKCC